ncbi:MAG TPA: rhomboid family intramembrane serine protease [Trueperaceae bacterium]|nr:rhomboid family intramembrane serine protease [Trueperaceae bacterium]
MTPAGLALLLLAFAGVSSLRWAARLAPAFTELPMRSLIATLLSVLALAGELGWAAPSPALRLAALVVGPVFVFAPLLLLAVVRAGRAGAAAGLARLLYWTPTGRRAVGRWLAVAALQEGDPVGALRLAPDPDDLLLAQARALQGRWREALEHALAVARGDYVDDARALARDLAVAAHLELGEPEAAEAEARALADGFDASRHGPLAYRAVTLANARVAAHRGELERVKALLAQPIVGARPAVLYALLARAAARAGDDDLAVASWQRAHADARGVLRERYAGELGAYGVRPVRPRTAAPPYATYGLVVAIALAFLGQSLLDRVAGPVALIGVYLRASDFVAAYSQLIPGVPGEGAWWRYLSYAFVHANIVHAAFNAWVLLDLGRAVERRRGWGDVLAAFAAGVAGGSLLASVAAAGRPLLLVGASGGVFGVAAALTLDAAFRRSAADAALLRTLAMFLGLNLLFSLLPGVSLWGHVGGLVAGGAYAALRRALPSRAVGSVLGLAGVGALAVALGTALVVVLPTL